MNKKTLNRGLSWTLVGLFLLTMASLVVGEIHPAARAWNLVHNISGALMLAGSALHLALHSAWIKTVILRRPKNLGPVVRRSRRMAVGLSLTYLVCGLSGLLAWAFPGSQAASLHHISGMLMLAMLLMHIALHHRWYANQVRSAIESRFGTARKTHSTGSVSGSGM